MSVERLLARLGFTVAAVLAAVAAASAQGIGGAGLAAQASLRGGVSLFLVFAVVLLAASAALLACALFAPAEATRDREYGVPTWE